MIKPRIIFCQSKSCYVLLLFALGLSYDKTDLISAYDDDKAMIADELHRLERQQAIRETDIDVALEICEM